jgi:long-chain acyl-CoA synthetase
MMATLKTKKRTKEAIDSEGYFHTGDLGYQDKDGFVIITGPQEKMSSLTRMARTFSGGDRIQAVAE